jgi:hypothetical protein
MPSPFFFLWTGPCMAWAAPMARLRRPVGVLPLTRGYPGTLPSVQGNTFPLFSSENPTIPRGAMDGGAWPAATAGTSVATRLKSVTDGSIGTRSSWWFGLCHLLAMRVAGRASSPVRQISSASGMGGRQFFDFPRLGDSGTTRGGGERLLGVVALRVEGIGGRCPVGGESSQRAGGARAATMGRRQRFCLRRGKEVGF